MARRKKTNIGKAGQKAASFAVAKSGAYSDPRVLASSRAAQPALAPKRGIELGALKGLNKKMAEVYNTFGSYIESKAQTLGVKPALIAAVINTESGGRAFTQVGGSDRPVIRFENHHFYKFFTNGGKDANRVTAFQNHFRFNSGEKWKGHEFRSSESGSWEGMHKNQEQEYRVFEYAKSLDEDAAYKSISSGMGQIMGSNFKAAGYNSAKEMFEGFAKGPGEQLDGVFGFIQAHPKALSALRDGDTVGFAKVYNGSGQAQAYGGKIAEASRVYEEVTKGLPPAAEQKTILPEPQAQGSDTPASETQPQVQPVAPKIGIGGWISSFANEIAGKWNRYWSVDTYAAEIPTSVAGKADNRFFNPVNLPSDIVSPHSVVADGGLTGPFYPENYQGGALGAPGDAVASGRATLFVNGIQTSLEEHMHAAFELATANGKPVVGVYNKSSSVPLLSILVDVAQCGMDKSGGLAAKMNPAVTQVAHLVKKHGEQDLDIFAHSQGSIIVSSALVLARNEGADLSKIDFTSFGNAIHTVPKGLRGYHNFAYDNDPVTRMVGSESPITSLLRFNDSTNPAVTAAIAMQMSLVTGMTFGVNPLGYHSMDSQGMAFTDDRSVTLHHPGSGFDAHSVVGQRLKDQSGNTKRSRDGKPLLSASYIGQLKEFREKERLLYGGQDQSEANGQMPQRVSPQSKSKPSGGGNIRASVEALAKRERQRSTMPLSLKQQAMVEQLRSEYEKGHAPTPNVLALATKDAESVMGKPKGAATSKGDVLLLRRGPKGEEVRREIKVIGPDSNLANIKNRIQEGASQGSVGEVWLQIMNRHARHAVVKPIVDSTPLGRPLDVRLYDHRGDYLYHKKFKPATVGDFSSASGGAIQRRPGQDASSGDPEKIRATLAASGDTGFAPSADIKDRLAPFLAGDFSQARIHVGPQAAQAAQALGAEAFTIGRDVYFGAGKYDPATKEGMSLIGHELTHVIQQTGGRASGVQHSEPSATSQDSMETEAKTVGTSILNNLGSQSGLHVQRMEKTYHADEGIGRTDELRLDRIGEMAIRKAQSMLGRKSGLIETVSISIEIDLAKMSDDQASDVWAEAIVAQVHLSPVHSSATTAPAPKLIQRAENPAPAVRLPLPQDVQRAIEQDVDAITAELRSWSVDRGLILNILHRWRMMDIDTAGRYDRDTRHLDYLFTRLQIKTYDKGTIVANWVNAIDELCREFGGAGQDAQSLRRYMSETASHRNYRPADEPEGAASYVARHTLMGALGILKALGGAIMGLSQAALWAQWRASTQQRHALAWTMQKASDWFGANLKDQIAFFRSDDPPKADDYVARNFDDTAKIIIGWMGDLPADEKKKLFEEFNFGNKWGAIPANLMLLGAGGGGLTSKGAQWLLKGAMILNSAKAIEDASVALGKRIEEIQKQRPNATWWDVLADGEVLKQMTMIVVSAVSLGSSYAEAAGKSKEVIAFLGKLGYMGDWAQLGPIVKMAWDHYHDTALTEDQRKEKLEQDAIDFINQVISVGNSTKQRREQRVAEQKAAAEKLAMEQHAAEQKAAAAAQAAEIERQKQVAHEEHKAETGPVEVAPDLKKQQMEEMWRQREAEKAAQPKTFEETLTPEQQAARDKYFADQQGETRAPTPEELKKNLNLLRRATGRKASYEGETAPAKTNVPEEQAPAKKAFSDEQKQTAREQLAQDRETLSKPDLDPEYRKKLEKRVRKNENKLKDDHATPGIAAESKQSMDSIAKGGESGVAAAREMIKREQGWKAKLREAVSEKGAFKDVEGGMTKERVEQVGKVFDEARAQIINESAQKVLAANPHLADLIGTTPSGQAHRAGLFEAGTPGFKSDRDITARPKQEHIDALAKFDERAKQATSPEERAQIMREKSQRVAELVAASGEVVRLMNEELAKATGGIPDKTLDTNMYSWTGSEIKFDIPTGEMVKVHQGTDIASLTELHQRMDPKDWAKMKQQLIEGTGEYRGVGGEEMKQRLLDQIKQAESSSENLNARTNQEMERLKAAKPNESKQALEMEAKANVAFELNQRVVELMRQNPVPYGEIANLQSQIKILEPGAYGSQAGIKDVVLTQQPMSRDYDNYIAAHEALEKLQADPTATQQQLAEAHRKVRETEQASRDRYLKGEDLTPREMAQSAASTLAQLEDHNPAKHPPGSETEALTAIKDAYKYAGRIAYLEYQMTGQRVELPDVANYSRSQLKEMVQQWAKETGRNPETPLTQLALEYSQARLEKCREMVNRLKLEAMHADQRAPTDTPAQEAKQTEQKAANATVVGQKPVSNETTRNEGSTGNDRKTTRVNPRPGENQSEEDEKKGRP